MKCFSNTKRTLLALALFLVTASAQRPDRNLPPYASTTPLSQPTIFGAGIISTGEYDTHPASHLMVEPLLPPQQPNFNLWTILVSHS